MTTTPPSPAPPHPGGPVAGRPSGDSGAATGPRRRPIGRARRRSAGAGLGGLPLANVVIVEGGLAIGLVLLAVDTALLVVAAAVVVVAMLVALTRWRGRWLTQWVALTASYVGRPHERALQGADPAAQDHDADDVGGVVLGAGDPRVALLRLVVADLVVARSVDHEREPLGLAWHEGGWTAVLQVDAAPSLVVPLVGTPNLPLGALTPCLEDRGVVLDAIEVIWHCYPGSATLPSSAPALQSYLEVLGPLPAAARRTTWIAVRLDPRRCPAAVQERGAGVVGAHRALIGALSRVRGALAARGVAAHPLDADMLLRAATSAAELTAMAASGRSVALRERWTDVTAGGVGHASYAITGWPTRGGPPNLNALTGVRALSATVALSISPAGEESDVGLRGLVRVSARNPAELAAADERLQAISGRLGVDLTPLRGLQAAGLAGTLPLGASA